MSIFKFKFMTAFLFLAMLLQQGNSQAFSGYAQAQKSIYKNVFDKKRLELIVKNICEKKYLILAGASGVIFLGIAVAIIKKLFPGNPGDPVKPSDPIEPKGQNGLNDKIIPSVIVEQKKPDNQKESSNLEQQDNLKKDDDKNSDKIEEKKNTSGDGQETELKDLKPENTVQSVPPLIIPEGPGEKPVNNLEAKKEEPNCSEMPNIKELSNFETETQELDALIAKEGFDIKKVIQKDSFVKVEQKETEENTIDRKKQEEELEKFTEQELERQELEKKKIEKKKNKKDENASCDLDDFFPEDSSFEYYEIKGNDKKKLTCNANNEEELKELAGKYKLLDKPTKVACLIFIKDQSKDVREKFELFKNK